MAHESWTINAFKGEAQNQPGRITKRPDVVQGDFDRIGGISPLPYMYAPVALSEQLVGYDWLGVSTVLDGSQLVLRDAQSGNFGNTAAAPWTGSAYKFYVPGAGVYALRPNVGTVTDPDIPISFHVLPNGTPIVNTPLPASFAPSITVTAIAGSDIPAGARLHVVFIMFRHTPHGLIPVDLKWATAQTSSSGQGFQIRRNGVLASPDGFVLHAYARLSSVHKPWQWHRLYARPDEQNPFITSAGVIISKEDQVPFNSVPTFYGSPYNSPPPDHEPSQYTVSAGRAFYTAYNDVAIGLETEPTSPYRLRLKRYIPNLSGMYSKQHVFYTDAGHLAFTDDKENPLVLRFDDRIRALTPSVRGIYAFSEVGTWEAYGDFATASNTRISLVPVLGGVDDDGPKVTFSGDTAYFVKEGIIHAIGPGGVKQVGRPVFLNRPVLPQALWYDRFARRLLALFEDVVAVYDPNTDNWHRWPDPVPPMVGRRYIFNMQEDVWWVNGHVVTKSALPPGFSYPAVIVEYRKLDFSLPNLRKRLHLVTFAYDGDYSTVAVEVQPDGAGGWLPCNVLDQGGYFEARCPTPTFKHLDLRITVVTDDKDFAINPPLVFTFTRRGRKYHAR